MGTLDSLEDLTHPYIHAGVRGKLRMQWPERLHRQPGRTPDVSQWLERLYLWRILVSLWVFSLCSTSVPFTKLFISTFSLHLSSPLRPLFSASVSVSESLTLHSPFSLFYLFSPSLESSTVIHSAMANPHQYANTEIINTI